MAIKELNHKHFLADGQLRQVDEKTGKVTDEPFKFDVYGNQEKNQARYEKIADVSYNKSKQQKSALNSKSFSFLVNTRSRL